MRKKIIFLMLVAFILNGLVNHRELQELEIISAIGIDKIEDEKYLVTTQVINSKNTGDQKSGSTEMPKIITYYKDAKSIQEALRNTIDEAPQKLYIAHMKLLLLSEEAAKENIMHLLDFFLRDNEASNDFIVAISKNASCNDMLQILTPIEENPTTNIKDSIKTTFRYKGYSTDRVLNQDLQILLSEKENITLPSIYIKGDIKEGEKMDNLKEASIDTKILVDNLAYFNNKNELEGYLNDDDDIAYNLMHDNLKSCIVRVGEGENRVVVDVISAKTKLKPKCENDKYVVEADIQINANVTETGKNISTSTTEEVKQVKELIENEIKRKIERYIYNCKNVYNCDILGYENLFYKKLNKQYKNISEEFYTKYFNEIETRVKVEVIFKNEGGIIKKW